mmetsp:Transcript_38184/g.94946  ORF Transcript_38184/g.94946 Transcript_38184/m.94946 type:complete len:313 (+) Transcript_38184:1276-2214(+)
MERRTCITSSNTPACAVGSARWISMSISSVCACSARLGMLRFFLGGASGGVYVPAAICAAMAAGIWMNLSNCHSKICQSSAGATDGGKEGSASSSPSIASCSGVQLCGGSSGSHPTPSTPSLSTSCSSRSTSSFSKHSAAVLYSSLSRFTSLVSMSLCVAYASLLSVATPTACSSIPHTERHSSSGSRARSQAAPAAVPVAVPVEETLSSLGSGGGWEGEGAPGTWRRGATDEAIKSRIEPTAAKATSEERGSESSDFSQKLSSCSHARSKEGFSCRSGRKVRKRRQRLPSASTHVSSHCFDSVSREWWISM